jgi:WD40 repeat protein
MIKVWDYVRKAVTYQQMYSGAGTCIEHMAHSDGNKGRVCAVGFDNGLVRILSITADGIQLLKAFKAHDDAIACLKYTEDMKCLCTASVKGDVFFFETDGLNDVQMYKPICTFGLPETGVTDMKWNPDDNSIIIGCLNGKVYQIQRPKPDEIDSSDSFLWENIKMTTWTIKIMEF